MRELKFYLSYQSACTQQPITMDEMFHLDALDEEDFQVFCRDQREIDFLLGMSLMYGKELKNVSTWAEWQAARRKAALDFHWLNKGSKLKLKDFIISTFEPAGRFRGL